MFFYTEFSENICQIILYNTKWLLSKRKKGISSHTKRMRHGNFSHYLGTSFRIIILAILLNDSYGFRIRAHHMYVLPCGCAHDENILHPDYTQVFH